MAEIKYHYLKIMNLSDCWMSQI